MPWNCPECGSKNHEDISKCVCGYSAGESSKDAAVIVAGNEESIRRTATGNKIGWGWFILFSLLAAGVPKVHMYHAVFALLSYLSVFMALYIYFKFRKIFLIKNRHDSSNVTAGFKAGLLAYLICLMTVFVLGLIDRFM